MSDDCSICMEELSFDEKTHLECVYLETPCGHKFHSDCL